MQLLGKAKIVFCYFVVFNGKFVLVGFLIPSHARRDSPVNKVKGHLMLVPSGLSILLKHLNLTCDLRRGLRGTRGS